MLTHAPTKRTVQIFGIALALVNALLWNFAPELRAGFDSLIGREEIAGYPITFIKGAQELLVYFDPWLALYVFPIVFTLGLALIPYLEKTSPDSRSATSLVVVPIVLITLESIWLLLFAAGVCCRGPNWNFYWPWDEWVPRIEASNYATFSQKFFYLFWAEQVEEMPGRELPGVTLTGIYLLSALAIAFILYRGKLRATPYWRWLVFVLIIEIALLVPIRMLLCGMFNIKYWIFMPEYGFNL